MTGSCTVGSCVDDVRVGIISSLQWLDVGDNVVNESRALDCRFRLAGTKGKAEQEKTKDASRSFGPFTYTVAE